MRQLSWLHENRPLEPFPPAEQAMTEPNGLLAVGGDLTVQRLCAAYRNGIFPWYGEGQPILWWSPDPRGVFIPGDLHISRSLRRRINQSPYRVTLDCNFAAVVAGCAAPRAGNEGTWITHEMISAYIELHYRDYAHSVEVWLEDELVGGLYGVALNGAFFGESMFSRARDASKVALANLCPQLWRWGFEFLDCQMSNPHLDSMGAREIPRSDYLKLLADALRKPHRHSPWQFDDKLTR